MVPGCVEVKTNGRTGMSSYGLGKVCDKQIIVHEEVHILVCSTVSRLTADLIVNLVFCFVLEIT